MSERQERAVKLKQQTGDAHYNCCQAVACVFADEVGLASDTLRKLGAGFGLGMGNMEATCGALCGAQMILGLKKYQSSPIRNDAAELQKKFTAKCGASICKIIKGQNPEKKVLCSCDDCVSNAVELVEEFM